MSIKVMKDPWSKIIELDVKEMIDDTLMMCNSFTRFPTFLKMIDDGLADQDYWYALRFSYDMSDNLYEYRKEVKECFCSKEHHFRETLMTKREQNYFNSLPDIITIYRGMTINEYESGDFGVSWSLKPSVAKFFIDKYRRNISTNHLFKMVLQLTIKKSDAIAYFGGRKEYEIIYIHHIKE